MKTKVPALRYFFQKKNFKEENTGVTSGIFYLYLLKF